MIGLEVILLPVGLICIACIFMLMLDATYDYKTSKLKKILMFLKRKEKVQELDLSLTAKELASIAEDARVQIDNEKTKNVLKKIHEATAIGYTKYQFHNFNLPENLVPIEQLGFKIEKGSCDSIISWSNNEES